MILITGAAGYIGSHICSKLKLKKIKFCGIDNCSRGKKQNVKNFKFYKYGYSSKKILQLLINKKIKTVIHAGALTYPSESERNKRKYFLNNIKKSIEFIESCKDNGVENFIFLSSSNVYKFQKNKKIIIKPENYYGYTKLYVEKFLKKKKFFKNLVILRLYNIAGFTKEFNFKEYKSKFRRIMPILATSISKNKPINIYGKKTQKGFNYSVRDYLHIKDFLNLIMILIKNKVQNITLDVGSSIGISLKQIIKIFEKKIKKKINYRLKEKRIGELDYTCCKKNRTNDKIKWKPIYNIENIIQSTIDWKRKNENI